MKLCIIGQDTLAAATEECCRRHFELVRPADADVIWICFDTPIVDGVPNTQWVIQNIRNIMAGVPLNKLMLVSSQITVGTTRYEFPNHNWAYSPENIRVATAIADFENQSRIVVGIRGENHRPILRELLSPFTKTIIFTDPDTAEMVKHALNCWLGMNIAFINEVARISKVVGANVDVITQALRLDSRISPKAPLKAGPPFGGGHLARDINTMTAIVRREKISAPIISHIMQSNGDS